ncbi:hypothetical protein [Pseudoalteromonas sp. S326]|nr:hypothetical protein [Pseudoalteromonas sp. S326]
MFSNSTVDIALWDIKSKRLSAPLCQVAGGHTDKTASYAG